MTYCNNIVVIICYLFSAKSCVCVWRGVGGVYLRVGCGCGYVGVA